MSTLALSINFSILHHFALISFTISHSFLSVHQSLVWQTRHSSRWISLSASLAPSSPESQSPTHLYLSPIHLQSRCLLPSIHRPKSVRHASSPLSTDRTPTWHWDQQVDDIMMIDHICQLFSNAMTTYHFVKPFFDLVGESPTTSVNHGLVLLEVLHKTFFMIDRSLLLKPLNKPTQHETGRQLPKRQAQHGPY